MTEIWHLVLVELYLHEPGRFFMNNLVYSTMITMETVTLVLG